MRPVVLAVCLTGVLTLLLGGVVIFRPRVVSVEHVRPADAVVILGPSVSERTDLGESLVAQGVGRALVVSAHADDLGGDLPAPCRGGARQDVYCFDPRPATTQGEARSISELARRHGWTSLVVVTYGPQVERARLLLDRCDSGQRQFVESGETYDAVTTYGYQMGAFAKALVTPGC